MIKIPDVSSLEEEYYNKTINLFVAILNEMIEQQRAGETKYDTFISYVSNKNNKCIESVARGILTGNKEALKEVIEELGKMETIKSSKKNPSKGKKYELFDRLYNNFIGSEFGKAWAFKTKIKTCPYCNRAFIHTPNNGKIRAEYDHFFPKSLYPYLCISMYNIIPSCRFCNQLKGAKDTYEESFLYPFEEEFGQKVKFVLKPKSHLTDIFEGKFSIDFEIANKYQNDKEAKNAQENIKKLMLKELYNLHTDHARKILVLRKVYSDEYINGLFSTFSSFVPDIKTLKDYLFISKLSQDEWGEAILSKFTSDTIDFFDGKC